MCICMYILEVHRLCGLHFLVGGMGKFFDAYLAIRVDRVARLFVFRRVHIFCRPKSSSVCVYVAL